MVIEKGILRAQKSIWIATATLKDMQVVGTGKRSFSIVKNLNDLAKKGIQIKLLHSGEPSQPFKKSLYNLDRNPNFQMRQCLRSHFKAVIIDGSWMYMGSANMTGAGLGAKSEKNRNFEVGLVTQNRAEIDDIQSLFNLIWEGEMCIDCDRIKFCKKPLNEI